MRYPASWRTQAAEQDGVWYRYFLGPPAGPERKPSVSVTLLAGPLGPGVEEYAQTYLAGNRVTATREETRQGAAGKAWSFDSADGVHRYDLLLIKEGDKVFGLYAQGETPGFERERPLLEEMQRSLTLERAAGYPEFREPQHGFALRLPPSWKAGRHFGNKQQYLAQWTSPALAADKNRQTVHASLTLTVEPIGGDGSLEEFYRASREKLGDAFGVVSHGPWRDGYVDVLHTETSMAESRNKRFYRAAGGRGYTLTFEAREDAFPRVARWCDMIAGTLAVGSEAGVRP